MASRGFYGAANRTNGNGAAAVMPHSISISTVVPPNTSSLHQVATASTSSSVNAQHSASGKNGHAAATAAPGSTTTPTGASSTHTRTALVGDTNLTTRDSTAALRNDTSGQRAAHPGPAGAAPQHPHPQLASQIGGGGARRGVGDDVDNDEDGDVGRASESADDAAGSGSVANEALEYCGVRLLPGVEEIAFDEGYYVGTMDESGEMAGYGKATWHSGDTYEGEWLDGVMHGKGTYTWADGDYYRGSYVHGRMEGYGEMKDATGVYVGEWADDMRQGYGRMEYAGGNVYEGDWLAGMRHGVGKLVEPVAQVTYEGEFNRNEKEGRGVQTNADGDVYEGDFAKGKPNGRGTYLWADGARYIGMFKDGVKHGDGCEWLANGDWIAGLFVNGEHVDSQSTRHKATVLSAADDDGGERNGHADDGDAPLVNSLSDTTAAAVLAPLNAEKLRRLTCAAPSPTFATSTSASARAGRGTVARNSVTAATAAGTLNAAAGRRDTARQPTSSRHRDPASGISAAGGAQSPTEAAAASAGANAAAAGDGSEDVASPFARALAAPVMLLDDSDLEGWTQLKTIGKGSFGAVYTALLRNGRTVCCKVIELGSVENEEELEKLRNEIALMKRLRHPNCVQYYGSLEDKAKNTLNIFMEYVSGGTLTSFVTKFKSIPLRTLRQWAYQMVCGVRYLHECGIVHRDIKGDNVLVSVDGIVKLADFGCSKAIDDVCSATHGCSTMVGTPYWMAPEVIKCEAGGYGMKSDIWSVGCTMVEMLTGKPPWPECNSMWAAVYKIANSTGLPTEIPADVDPELMDLLSKCFERNPKMRPTAAEMLQHPFLAKAVESTTGSSSPMDSSRRN